MAKEVASPKSKVEPQKKVVTIKNKGMVLPNSLKKQSKLDVRCGDCLCFEKGPFLFGRACKLNGIMQDRPAPGCFNPDFTKLILGTNPHIMQQIGFFLSHFNVSQTRILSSVINRSLSLKKNTAFTFGQEVYINMSGNREYISNYFKGYVVGYLKANKTVFVSARMNKSRPYTSSLMVMPDTLLTTEKFVAHSKKLAEAGKIQDPQFKDIGAGHAKSLPDGKEVFDYEPPTLDSAPDKWFAPLHKRHEMDLEESASAKKKKRKIIDTVDHMDKFSIS